MDAGWDTDAMRDIAHAALQRAGTDAAHFRPAAEMNAHKLTLGVREAAVPACVSFIADAAAAAGLRAKVIASGTGGWQYIDVVAAGAGKLESLEYVRAMLGFSRAATVAAGDSGNDVAMLNGWHRAIVVGNAQPDLAAWAAAQCGEGGADVCATEASAPAAAPELPALRVAVAPGGNSVIVVDDDAVDTVALDVDVDVVDVEAVTVDVVATEAADPPPPPPPPAAQAAAAAAAVDVAPAAAAPLAAAAPASLAPAIAAAADDEEGPVDGARLYRASASQAWGVIEGLQHFGFA
jgi:hypothetical protein